MFIKCIQEEWKWQKLKYKLKKKQKKTWKHLWWAAESTYMQTQKVLNKKSDEDDNENFAQNEHSLNTLLQICLTFCFTLLQKWYI